MKFNPLTWRELDADKAYKSDAGRLMLKLDRPAAVFVTVAGVEALLGFGTEFDARIGDAYEVKVEGAKNVRVFVWEGEKAFHVSEGEVYADANRRPLESGSVLEVTAALRQMKLAHREMMREINANKAKAAERSEPVKSETPAKEAEAADGEEDKATAE